MCPPPCWCLLPAGGSPGDPSPTHPRGAAGVSSGHGGWAPVASVATVTGRPSLAFYSLALGSRDGAPPQSQGGLEEEQTRVPFHFGRDTHMAE